MTIKKALKISGYIFLPVIPMIVGAYFLFPYINEEKHEEITEEYEDEVALGDTTATMDASGAEDIGEDFATLKERSSVFQENIEDLKSEIDSLTTANDSLENELATLGENEDAEGAEDPKEIAENLDISDEEFSENVKSLLDLDNEDLSPIINKMSDDQLIRLYKVGSSLQRKKFLRALESERAAKLMTELM